MVAPPAVDAGVAQSGEGHPEENGYSACEGISVEQGETDERNDTSVCDQSRPQGLLPFPLGVRDEYPVSGSITGSQLSDCYFVGES